jgi:hypothetical protein
MPDHPQVFINVDPDPTLMHPYFVQEMATRAAATREFVGAQLAKSRRYLSVLEAMFSGFEHDLQVALEQATDEAASSLIARGFAWQERSARANLSVLERRVDHRGVELKLRNAKSLVREIEDCYQAWRDTEWALDRQVRLLQLRHAIGEI